jgi:RHS repeat-associated protein
MSTRSWEYRHEVSVAATVTGRDGRQGPATPSLSLPRGGGAIRGIGEKFAANPVTGSGSFSIPIATTAGRSGFGPQLSLSYDSATGNGAFGFGWSLALPAISRKTDKGLPQYRDAEESDVFILSAGEDLVPLQGADGARFEDTGSAPGFVIHRYRPRVEAGFARIERWTRGDGDVHWRSITRDNVTTLYGRDADSRIAGPRGVFSWLIRESHDDKGNAIVYDYAAENGAGVDLAQASEANRERAAGRYLKRIRYGNVVSRLVEPDLSQTTWLFEVVFDYDEGHCEDVALEPSLPPEVQHRFVTASPSAGRPWAVRPDPFSTFRAGFEVRTYRRCRRVLMFHHIPDLPSGEPGYDGLVRSTEFDYADLDYSAPVGVDEELAHQGSTRFASFIQSVTQSGYVRDSARPGVHLKRSLPPLDLMYSRAAIQDEVRELDPASLENLPAGLDGTAHRWVDLDGEGVSGILAEQPEAWYYKANLGDGRFGPVETVALQPSLKGARHQLVDLAGDGQLDLAEFAGPTAGFYERTLEAGWESFRAFAELPNAAWDDPNLRFVDLDGDGRTDVLIAENAVFTGHLSLAEDGFGPALRIGQPTDEERGPRLVFADGEQSIHLADMCGDGLTDLVRIRDGEVCYWPNLGYGRFGAKVTMDDAPRLDRGDAFEQRRVLLADVDGSGTNDLIYLGADGVRVYFNQSGNRWSRARRLVQLPHLDNVSAVQAADLLGNGTACLVWSSPLPADARRPVRYVDLMGGVKPHLLVALRNNLGAETRIEYAPSTRFYLADKRDGRPWITRLPFPVHVVVRVETDDRVSGNRFVTRSAYHEGHYDGYEREFRGFGYVERWDTEEIAALRDGPGGTNVDESSCAPPVYTRTWFHTGVFADRDRVSRHLADAYYRAPGLTDEQARALLLEDTVLPAGLSADEEREACRALRGFMLREEVFARDDGPATSHPYSVSEHSYTVRALQRRGVNRHAVLFTHPRERLDYRYERDPADPRIGHTFTFAVDDFGNVLESASVGYGRRHADPSLAPEDQARQAETLITYSRYRYTNAVSAAGAFRAPLVAETRTFELTGVTPAGVRFRIDDLPAALAAAPEIPYEQTATPGAAQKRLVEHARTVYRRDDLSGPLALGALESLALLFETYRLAFTPGLVTTVYGSLVTDALLSGEGRYVHSDGDGNWWEPSGRMFFSADPDDGSAQELDAARAHFFMPQRFRDPFHTDGASTERFVTHDPYDLLVEETRDALGNRVTAGERNVDPAQPLVRRGHDYRALQPTLVMDANRNRSAVAFDALGEVAGTAVMGKPEESPVPGDRLAPAFRADLTAAEVDAVLADPTGPAAVEVLGDASTRIVYDIDAHRRDPARRAPAASARFARETHASGPAPAGELRIQASISYSDGFAREIQAKALAEPGPTPHADHTDPRWVGTGWTVFDNKGRPVRTFEPFFTDTHRFEFDVRVGVSTVRFHDPLGRVVATLHPNHTWEKLRFGPWCDEHWDVNDTVLLDPATDDVAGPFLRRLPAAEYLPTWHDQRAGGALGAAEQEAAAKTAVHTATPSPAYVDSFARAFLRVAHNRFERGGALVDEGYPTRVRFDIEGNQREIRDAAGRPVMRHDYNMLGVCIHHAGMDMGERWILHDVAAVAIRTWDGEREFRVTCDRLHRPVESRVREANAPEQLITRTIYGESEPEPEAANLRERVARLHDSAGVVTHDRYDFKGNLLRDSRRFAREYRVLLDWAGPVALESETFTTTTTYDALDRPTSVTTADLSVYRPSYNESGRLEKVAVNVRGAPAATAFVTNIDYDAKGQRTRIDFGSGVATTYAHDPLTLRLVNVTTLRAGDQARLQDLSYTYDAIGHVTRIEDAAQSTVFFANQVVTARADYTYDAVYRLIDATGREHIGQAAQPQTTWDDRGRVHLPHPGDGQAMRRYSERYEYDTVGNILRLVHQAANGQWTRSYAYEDPQSNRLSSTAVGAGTPETYTYDGHGNTLTMPHLTLMRWDYRDQLQASARQVVSAGSPETTYYVYDAGGRRVRKVTDRVNGGTRKSERLYLGAFERFRSFTGSGAVDIERETLHVSDDRQPIVLVETRTHGDDGSPAGASVRYQFDNHLGSATLELDGAGAVLTYEEFYPYGSTAYQAGRTLAEVSLKRYRHTGAERDEETGFGYHGARYYAPWLGRWTAADPLGVTAGLNLYAYCSDNPINRVDHSGEEDEKPQPKSKSRFGGYKKAGRVYEKAWLRHFETRHDTGRIVSQSRWKDATTLKTKLVIGRWRKPDLGVEMPGRTLAVEIGSPPSFSDAKKIGQLAQDAEAMRRGLVLASKEGVVVRPTESFQARGLPIVGEGGNVPGSPKVQLNKVAIPPAAPVPAAPPVPETPPAAAAGPAVGVKAVVTGAFVGAVLLGPGSAGEKAKTLGTAYALDKAVTGVTTKAVGAELAGMVSLGVGFALTLCGDSARSCEDQARAKALEELEDEFNRRVDKRFDEEGGAELSFVKEQVLRQMMHERGLDKPSPRRPSSLSPIGECRKDELMISPSVVPPPVSNFQAPQMSAR